MFMKNYAFMIVCLLGISMVFFSSCKDDALLEEEKTMEPTSSPKEFFDTELIGVIRDTDGSILSGVKVQADGKETTTNEFGFYALSGISSPNTGLYIKAEKDGYFVGGTHYFPKSAGTASSEITLIKKEIRSFSSTDDLLLELPKGATLSIPAGGFSLNGSAYLGEVNIASTWLDPEDRNTFSTMPGALLGINANEDEQILQTYGMMAVEMEDGQGNTLQLKEGVSALLTFPLSSALESEAPTEIHLWHFDEDAGVWIEEGRAIKENGVYKAEVTHFSWWNCDDPFAVTGLCIDVVDQRGVPIDNYSSCITATGVTLCNNSGHDCGLIPSEMVLTIEFYDVCGEVFHTQDIGPYSGDINDTNTETIVVSLPNLVINNFTGLVFDCNGNSISDDAMVSLAINGRYFYDMDLDANGYEISFVNCSDDEEDLTLTALDLDALQQNSETVSLVSGQRDYDQDLSTCGQTISTNVLILNTQGGQVTYEDCTVIQSAVETLIIAKGTNTTGSLFIGFKGFNTGSFSGNLLGTTFPSGANSGYVDQATIEIDTYGEVGEIVKGNFSESDVSGGIEVSGSFVITRER